jgi:hypothetical protein
MTQLKSLEEANEVSAIRFVGKRQRAKVGDIFRLSPFNRFGNFNVIDWRLKAILRDLGLI